MAKYHYQKLTITFHNTR